VKYLFIIFFVSSILSNAADKVETMKKNIQNIGKEIQKKGERVQKITTERESLKAQIEKIEREMKEIENEKQKILQEIKMVSRTLDYGEKNLKMSKTELNRKQNEYKAKLLAWNRYSSNLEGVEKSIGKRNFINSLYGDRERITQIKEVHEDIRIVKDNTELEKKKLNNLQARLQSNLKSSEQKKVEHKRLINKLAQEQSLHEKAIAKLKQEKQRIEKEVERIIAARAKANKNIKMDTAMKNLGKLLKPISGNIVVRFGQKKVEGVASNGIEILGKMGSQVKAASNGKVIYADDFNGLGKVIMIDYGSNMIGVYGNLIGLNVKLNQAVKKGNNIGILGHSVEGKPNLYYELRFNLKPVDPTKLF
jgi:septal ring factor EnvC (AmiA/AmiB activator)